MIRLTAPQTYTATIGGVEWHGITPSTRFWPEVQRMIARGDPVSDETTPPVPSLADLRDAAFLTKEEFLIGVTERGWITPAEKLQAARGNWPDSLSPALVGIPEADAIEAQFQWAIKANIARMNLTVLQMAAFKEITAAQLDELFRVTG